MERFSTLGKKQGEFECFIFHSMVPSMVHSLATRFHSMDETTMAKRWRAKKWPFGRPMPVGYVVALPFFCQLFFDFMKMPTTAVKGQCVV
jgi:hypothetical protein